MKHIDLKRGHAYHHETYGTCFLVGYHPQDGAAYVVAYHDEREDEEVFKLAIPEELTHEVFDEIVFPEGHEFDMKCLAMMHMAHLIGTIFMAGNFKAETANERELEALLVKYGYRYKDWDESIKGSTVLPTLRD